jgi:hypothetical protein
MKLDPCNSNVKGESRTNSSTRCHACGRVNKQYKRRIHKDMINGLVRLYNKNYGSEHGWGVCQTSMVGID